MLFYYPKEAKSPEEREPHFETSLTSIYFFTKVFDFEAGGDAKICLEFMNFKKAILDFVLREKGSENMDKSIEYSV